MQRANWASPLVNSKGFIFFISVEREWFFWNLKFHRFCGWKYKPCFFLIVVIWWFQLHCQIQNQVRCNYHKSYSWSSGNFKKETFTFFFVLMQQPRQDTWMLVIENFVLPLKLDYLLITLIPHPRRPRLHASFFNFHFKNLKLQLEISDLIAFLGKVALVMFSKDGLRKMEPRQLNLGQGLQWLSKAWSQMAFRAIENGWLVKYLLWVSRLVL